MGNLGDVLTSMGHYHDAELLLAEAVAGARRSLPQGHGIAGLAIRKYGRCLTALGRYAESEDALLEAYDIHGAAGCPTSGLAPA